MKARTTRASGLLGVAIGAATLLLGGCALAQTKGADSVPSKKSPCGIEGFTKSPSEHIVVELDRPLRVRTVEGTITSQGGEWPEGTFVLFELRPNGKGKLRKMKTVPSLPGIASLVLPVA
jgi:hypothetical protein